MSCFSTDEGYYQGGKFQFETEVPDAYNMVVSSLHWSFALLSLDSYGSPTLCFWFPPNAWDWQVFFTLSPSWSL